MFYLHVSNRTENLLHQLAEVIRVDKQPDLFSGELFLIQSQGMERMVAQTLADEFSSFCNFQFHLPLDFLSMIADRLDMGITPDGFGRQTLTFRIEQLLTDIEGTEYQPLHYYLQGDNRNLKRFQLSKRLANVFDQYQLMRSDMLLSWEEGVLTTGHVSEPWQMAIWRRLIAQPGGDVHRGMLLHSVIEALTGQDGLTVELPKRIAVIGLHTMPPLFLEYLNALSLHMDVHFFLLSPCQHYWGDVQTKKQQFRSMIRSGVAPGAGEFSDHHPLLASLGRQGKDLQSMMLEGADFSLEFTSYESPIQDGGYGEARLLQKVQADLLEGEIREGVPVALSIDDSIQIVSCHSKLRELTVLRDHLLHLLHTEPGLELRDIIVMAPDIQEYAPLIPALFIEIQHSIADRSVRRRNSVFAGFLAFIELFSGRFGWSEVLDILRQPAIFPQFDLSLNDFDSIEYWVTEAGIRWGLSADQRVDSGLRSFEENSWRAGLDRLLMGYASGDDDFIDGVLPFTELEGRGAAPLGGLCRFIDIIDEARISFRVERSLGDWSELLLGYVSHLFGEEGDKELMELRMLVADLGRTMDGFSATTISFDIIREWFNGSAQEKRTSSGFLRGQLTFCSMLPMRSIPFKVVCLLGLNDGKYPTPDTHDNFDLMGEAGVFRLGDRSARADDRYQFLEAILAARENLYLSYIGQSAQTNEKIPPSVVVTELLEVLELYYGAKDLVVHHPLHSFSSKYFVKDGSRRLKSYDNNSCEVAKRLRAEKNETPAWWQGNLEPPGKKVELNSLFLFFNNPQKYFVRHSLGVQLATIEELPEDRETFQIEGLAKYHIEQALIKSKITSPNNDGVRDGFLKKAQVAANWPLGAAGELTFLAKNNEIERFMETVSAQEMGGRCSAVTVNFMVDDYHVQGPLDNIYENGMMIIRYGALRGRDLVSAWLHHLVANRFSSGGDIRTVLVTKDEVFTFISVADGPSLPLLLDLFFAGQSHPSEFYVEPAFVYAKQMGGRGTISPLDKATAKLNDQLEKGYEPELELLLQNKVDDSLLGELFEQLATEIMCPLLENTNG
ncbi:MAG: exodeoxyribonuclease V gamma subunit [Desulforhopalus sp.]|jgi:exodeoxyribonuclease V gamma subunit